MTTAGVSRLDWCCDLCCMPILAGPRNQEKWFAVGKSIAIDFVPQFRRKRDKWKNLLLRRRSRASGSFRSFDLLYWMTRLAWAAEAVLSSLELTLLGGASSISEWYSSLSVASVKSSQYETSVRLRFG